MKIRAVLYLFWLLAVVVVIVKYWVFEYLFPAKTLHLIDLQALSNEVFGSITNHEIEWES